MAYYRLCFGKGGRAGCFDEFSAPDDQSALGQAKLHMPSGYAELWCGERQVATVRGPEHKPGLPRFAVPRTIPAWIRPEAE